MSFFSDGTFIIAELSANHNNDLQIALKTIEAMAESGADAVKIQTYRPESLALDVDNEYFGPKKTGAWKGKRPWDLYCDASTPYEWHQKLKEVTESLGMTFFSSPFDLEGVDFLEELGVQLYKIASFEINDIPLIRKVAATGKPVIISTGVASTSDIELALQTCFEQGNKDITLLKCTSEYPAEVKDANLLTIPEISSRFKVKVGLSDHTMGDIVPTVAVSLGASVVEKHFILDRKMGGADSHFSMEPAEFKEMVDKIREVELALGHVKFDLTDEQKYKRRSLFVVKDVAPGDELTSENIRSLRPGVGLAPKFYDEVLGKRATKSLTKGKPLAKEDYE